MLQMSHIGPPPKVYDMVHIKVSMKGADLTVYEKGHSKVPTHNSNE